MSFEKVNPSHPDKIADRIAGAIVDLAYAQESDPRIAVEVLIGHGNCHIITESSVKIQPGDIRKAVYRITGTEDIAVNIEENPQDEHLAENQEDEIRCGDNGIFKGVTSNLEESELSRIVRDLYKQWPTDGKYILDKTGHHFIACQSNANEDDIEKAIKLNSQEIWFDRITVNPLGPWTGGTDVDTGATNRKLGSDMGRAVTGGGLHGKDLSKADVSINIACHILAKDYNGTVTATCAIGDGDVRFRIKTPMHREVMTIPYGIVVEMARGYIADLGGFEKLAEWGLV